MSKRKYEQVQQLLPEIKAMADGAVNSIRNRTEEIILHELICGEGAV